MIAIIGIGIVMIGNVILWEDLNANPDRRLTSSSYGTCFSSWYQSRACADEERRRLKVRIAGQPKVVILSFLSCGSTDAILGWARICWTSPRKRKKRTTSWPDNCLYNPVGPNTFHFFLLLYVLGHRIMNLLLVFSFHTAYKRKRKRMCDHMFERFLSFF